MIVRPSRRSTRAASTFIATSHSPVPRPTANRPAPTATGPSPPEMATPAKPRPITSTTVDPVTVRGAPAARTTAPAIGIATTEPADTPNSSSPSWPAVSPSASRAAGTRANHEATARPLSPKTQATDVRADTTRDASVTAVMLTGDPFVGRPRSHT